VSYFPQGVVFDGENCQTPEVCSIFKVFNGDETKISRGVDLRPQNTNTEAGLAMIGKDILSLAAINDNINDTTKVNVTSAIIPLDEGTQ